MDLIIEGLLLQKDDRREKGGCCPQVCCYCSRLEMSKFDQTSMTNRPWILDQFLIDFEIDLGVMLGSKIDQNSMSEFDRFLDASWEGSGAPSPH